jgi:SAM-dependent methyltransferase
MFRCGSCRTAFVHPQPSEEFLREFYGQFHEGSEFGGTYEAFEARAAADFKAKIDRVISHGAMGAARVLDLGCGKGFFVKACLERGLDAVGVDLSETAIRYAREVLDVPAHCGRIQDIASSLGAFDGVTFWATLEHVRDPVDTLEGIRRVLRPNGLLFLDTGIGDDFTDRMLPGVNQWYDPPQHLWVFSRAGLTNVLQNAGFEVLSLDTSFERSCARRLARVIRNSATAVALRAVGCATRLKSYPFEGTKFPLGNLMLAVGRVRG